MAEITLNGQRAVKVNAEKILWANSEKAAQYDIDGDKEWIPNSLCKFTQTGDPNKTAKGNVPGTLIIVEWFYNKLFPNG
jgi:hypothetical protein